MNFEQNNSAKNLSDSNSLASAFRKLDDQNLNSTVFEELERSLENAGYKTAERSAILETFNDSSLYCRSENFSKVIDLITNKTPVDLTNDNDSVNICTMSSGEGYKVAMTEGFSGKDVNNLVKVVLSFKGDNLSSRSPMSKDNALWDFKPNTAAVSLSANGQITSDDMEMISFRFPVHYYPEHMLSSIEKEDLEENKIEFIVRHYRKNTEYKKATH